MLTRGADGLPEDDDIVRFLGEKDDSLEGDGDVWDGKSLLLL